MLLLKMCNMLELSGFFVCLGGEKKISNHANIMLKEHLRKQQQLAFQAGYEST